MPNEDERLAAYLDGVAELTAEQRRDVEAALDADPRLRAEAHATRRVLDDLRALGPEGTEPAWLQLERSIRDAVGPRVPRTWWRRRWGRWLVPAAGLAVAGAVTAIWMHARAAEPAHAPPSVAVEAAPADVAPDAERDGDTVALWLDGRELDVGLDVADLLGVEADPVPEIDDGPVDGLLPTANLAAVDELSDDELTNLEQWLGRKKS